ncbi:Uncharacterised protein [Mycobacteroides abscessus subsp. abscessus]|nr:Uncharacterised protein [Mycobacteroides abscessus subsp. abscessus]
MFGGEVVVEVGCDVGDAVDAFRILRHTRFGVEPPRNPSGIRPVGDHAGGELPGFRADPPVVHIARRDELVDVGESAVGPVFRGVMHLHP